MTDEQRALAGPAAGWAGGYVRRFVPRGMYRKFGAGYGAQEAMLAVCRSAAAYDPVRYPGVPFAAFAKRIIRMWVSTKVRDQCRVIGVWHPLPHEGLPDLIPDVSRESGRDYLLAIWCDPDNERQRVNWPWRRRVWQYLIGVEGWDHLEVARVFGVSRQRVYQVLRPEMYRKHRWGKGAA